MVVTAQRAHDEAGTDVLEVSVADNGSGYAPDTSTRQGLGTQIVEALITDLRGQIRWETAKPHGTVVRFTVRLRGSATG